MILLPTSWFCQPRSARLTPTMENKAEGSLFDNFENYQPIFLTAINVSAGADYQAHAPLALIEIASDRSHYTHTRMGINTNKLASSPGARTRLGDP